MVKKHFLHRKLGKAVLLCCMLSFVACSQDDGDIVETEVAEIEVSEMSEMVVENTESETEVETQVQETESENTEHLAGEKVTSWVADLDVAQTVNQIIVVAAEGSNATVSMHNKEEDGTWTEMLSTAGKIGRNGIGKTAEGDGKTPTGQYSFMFGFGNMPDPGCGLPYTQVDSSYYWVDDSDSAYYNQFVSTDSVTKDWDSAEHIASVKKSYNYVLAIDYNVDCVPGAGSAIFMHCQPTGGAGCIAVQEEKMVEIMKNVQDGCMVIIDSVEGVKSY